MIKPTISAVEACEAYIAGFPIANDARSRIQIAMIAAYGRASAVEVDAGTGVRELESAMLDAVAYILLSLTLSVASDEPKEKQVEFVGWLLKGVLARLMEIFEGDLQDGMIKVFDESAMGHA